MTENEHNFILLVKKVGKKRERSLVSSFRSSSSKVELLPGTLLILTENVSKGDKYFLVLETFDSDVIEVQCIPGEVEKIGVHLLELLQPVTTCAERLGVYQDKDWLAEGLRLKKGDHVFVKVKGHPRELLGIIRYRGPVPDMKGIYFGIELVDNPGAGTSDGTFRKKHFFHCQPDSAVFCAIHKIRNVSNKLEMNGRLKADGTIYNASSKAPVSDASDCDLKIGDRVVWMSDQGPESGTVKWIGVLPGDARSERTVGVEFDQPVGSGTGKYKEHRLFFARQNHASLVPILGLMKEEEFYNGNQRQEDVLARGLDQEDVLKEQELILEQLKNQASVKPGANDHFDTGYGLDNSGYKAPCYSDVVRNSRMDFDGRGQSTTTTATVHNVDYLEPGNIPERAFKHNCDPGYVNNYSEHGLVGKAEPALTGMNPLYEYQKLEDSESEIKDDSYKGNSQNSNITPPPDPDLSVDSMVEVLGKPPLYGVIRWIGSMADQPWKQIAGLEMEAEISAGTDGTFKGERFFECAPKRALFVPLYKCHKDKRFHSSARKAQGADGAGFGLIESPDVPGSVSPPSSLVPFNKLFGKNKGIQGHHNSCYLDATLFAMFSYTTVFDSVLHRPRNAEDIQEYDDVQKVLKEGIVNPLRKYHYVRADKVMKLRILLDKLGKIPGMMSEEKDPEEFMSLILSDIMKADPLLRLSSGADTNFYQLFMEKDELLLLPTTQKLVELSFLQCNVKLKEVPSCLIIQMPRFGKDYKMFRRIIPSLELDITDILEEGARECIICGDLAAFECKECYQMYGPGLNATAFCENCKTTSHQHKNRRSHHPQPVKVSKEFAEHWAKRKAEAEAERTVREEVDPGKELDISVHREKMELFAVVCIQTSHYVSFVKCGSGKQAPWVFFDSMADRMGEQKGYNIPEVKEVQELSQWLSEDSFEKILSSEDDKDLPGDIRRLLCDAYMCLYQSPDVAMFK